MNWQVYQIRCKCSTGKICRHNSQLPREFNLDSNENPYLKEVLTPRPEIHYVVVPKSTYLPNDPENKCPTNTSLTYIKSLEEWNDWKFIRGKYEIRY